jgi:hypothetical protein
MALELGVSPKTLWGWETDRRQPTAADDGTFFESYSSCQKVRSSGVK